jgi:hypothetical protein
VSTSSRQPISLVFREVLLSVSAAESLVRLPRLLSMERHRFVSEDSVLRPTLVLRVLFEPLLLAVLLVVLVMMTVRESSPLSVDRTLVVRHQL